MPVTVFDSIRETMCRALCEIRAVKPRHRPRRMGHRVWVRIAMATTASSLDLGFAGPSRFAGGLSKSLVLEPMRAQAGVEAIILDGRKWIIGAGQGCTMRLQVDGVDERHCLILNGPHGPIVKSWGQRTWLNDRPVREAGLRDGDRLAIGPVVLRVRKARPNEQFPESQEQPTGPEAESIDFEVTPTVAESATPESDTTARAAQESVRGLAGETPIQTQLAATNPATTNLRDQAANAAQPSEKPAEPIAAAETVDLLRRERHLARLLALRAQRRAQREANAEADRLLQTLVARREELDSREVALRAQADALTGDLGPRAEELARREEAIAKRLADAATRETVLSAREQRLDAAEQLAARTTAGLSRKRGLVSDLAGELLTHQGTIDAQKRAVEHDRLSASRQLEEAATRLAEAARQEIDVRKQLNELTTRESILATRNEGLERQLRELASGMDRLTERQASLAARTAEIEAQARAAEALQATLDERAAALAGREQQLNQRDADYTARWQAVVENEARVEALQSDLQARTDQLDSLATELEAARVSAATHASELDNQAAALARTEAALASREADVATAAKVLEQRAADLQLQADHLVAREQSVTETEQLLAARAELVAARTAEVDSKSVALDERIASLTARDAEIERVRQALEADREELARREQDQREVHDEMDREIARLAAEESRLEERAEELAQRERETDERFELLSQRETSLDRRERVTRDLAPEDLAAGEAAALVETRVDDPQSAERLAWENRLAEQELALQRERERLAAEASELESARRELDSRRENLAAIAALVGPISKTPTSAQDQGVVADSGADQAPLATAASQAELDALTAEMASRVAEIEAREAALVEQEAILEAARNGAVELQSRLTLDAERLDAEQAALEAERQALDSDRQSLDAQAEGLNQQEATLTRREAELAVKMEAAERGQGLADAQWDVDEFALPEPASQATAVTDDNALADSVPVPALDAQPVPEIEGLDPAPTQAAALDQAMQDEIAALEAELAAAAQESPNPSSAEIDSLLQNEDFTGIEPSTLAQPVADVMEDWFRVPPSARQFEQSAPDAPLAELDPNGSDLVGLDTSEVVAEFSPMDDLSASDLPKVPNDWSALDAQLTAWETQAGHSGSLVPSTLDFPELVNAPEFPAVSTLSLDELASTRLVPELSEPESLSQMEQTLDQLAESYGASSAASVNEALDGSTVTGQEVAAWDDLAETDGLMETESPALDDAPQIPDERTADDSGVTADESFGTPDAVASSPTSFPPEPALLGGTTGDTGETHFDDEARQLLELESRLRREREELAALEQRWRNPDALVPPVGTASDGAGSPAIALPAGGIPPAYDPNGQRPLGDAPQAFNQSAFYPPILPPVGANSFWPMPTSSGELPAENTASGPDRSPLEADDTAPVAESAAHTSLASETPTSIPAQSTPFGPIHSGPAYPSPVFPGTGYSGPAYSGPGFPGPVPAGPVAVDGLPGAPGVGPAPAVLPGGPAPYPAFFGGAMAFPGMYMLPPPVGEAPQQKLNPADDVPRPKAEPFFPTQSGPLINKISALGLPSELESLPNLDLSDDTSSLLGMATRMDDEAGLGMYGEMDTCPEAGGVAVEQCPENGALLSEDDLAELQESQTDSEERSSRPVEPGNVRSLLAEMFGIAELAQTETEPAVDGPASTTDSAPAEDGNSIDLSGLNLEMPPAPEAAASAAEASAAEPAAEPEMSDDDSISQYMEKLLARSRPGGGVSPTVVVAAPSVESAQKTLAPAGTSVEDLDLSQLTETDGETHPVHPVGPMVPRAKVDPNELRIRNDFLREVANKTARLALARHRQRQQRTNRLFKAAVTTASLALGGAILSGIAGGNRLQNVHAYVAIGIGLFMGSSLAQDLLRIRKAKRDGQLSTISPKPTDHTGEADQNKTKPVDLARTESPETEPVQILDRTGSPDVPAAIDTAAIPPTNLDTPAN